MDFVHDNDLIVKNTTYSKTNKNRCTYKNKNMGHKGGKPWNTTNYGQVDHILIENRWKNVIYKVWSTPYSCITSDHFPVIARMRVKFAKNEKRSKQAQKSLKIDHWKTMVEDPGKLMQ